MPKKTTVCLLALAVILCASAFSHIFYIVDGGNGTLFWNSDTAYLFLNLDSLGYRMSYIQYVGQIVREVLGAGRKPSDERFSVVVVTMNSGNVHRYILDDMRLSEYFVIDGSVLSGDQKTGILWKWDENHFERATAQEHRDLTKAGASHMPGPEYDDVDGWHKRINIFSHEDKYIYIMNIIDGRYLITRDQTGTPK